MLYQETLICILLLLNICSGFIDLSDVDYCSLPCGNEPHTVCRYPYPFPIRKCNVRPLSMDEKKGILQVHNELRARLARGEETKGKDGQPQPKASNMLRMRWDFELEAIARRWGLQCEDGHDKCRNSPRFSVGQNVHMGGMWDPVERVDDWYSEVERFDPAQVNPFNYSDSTGHYSQFVWAETYLVGCAMSVRDKPAKWRRVMICNYGPTGNMEGVPMYVVGEPASACPRGATPDETYPGLCSTDKEDFEDIKLANSIRLMASPMAVPMPLTVLLIVAMIFRKGWDLLCAFTAL